MATLGTLLAPDLIQTGSSWQLCADVNGYSRSEGASLTTQACRGRRFRILERQPKRIAVQLLEDGYRCCRALGSLRVWAAADCRAVGCIGTID